MRDGFSVEMRVRRMGQERGGWRVWVKGDGGGYGMETLFIEFLGSLFDDASPEF